MRLPKRCLLCGLLLIQIVTFGQAQEFLYYGQLSSWFALNKNVTESSQLGIRYIPALSFSTPLSNRHKIDVEASVKVFNIGHFQSASTPDYEKDFSPYRLWLRLYGSQYELRVGLQKINFGSASIFRPLMWFDTIDPRDPLQITSGVYGILGRYYFLNNANIWLWGLLGNEDPKGWELMSTAKGKPEFGGRVQIPLFTGEAAVSYHHRQLESGGLMPVFPVPNAANIPENRFAFDGKWDFGIGFWLEGVLTHHKSKLLPYEWEQSYNIGLDYTFAVGTGLNVMTEYFVLENTNKILQAGEGVKFSTVSVNYSLGVLDNIGGIVYYDWDNEDCYRLLSLQRNYDKWSFYLFAFWNPDEYKLNISSRESTQFAGKGIQFMVVFNH